MRKEVHWGDLEEKCWPAVLQEVHGDARVWFTLLLKGNTAVTTVMLSVFLQASDMLRMHESLDVTESYLYTSVSYCSRTMYFPSKSPVYGIWQFCGNYEY